MSFNKPVKQDLVNNYCIVAKSLKGDILKDKTGLSIQKHFQSSASKDLDIVGELIVKQLRSTIKLEEIIDIEIYKEESNNISTFRYNLTEDEKDDIKTLSIRMADFIADSTFSADTDINKNLSNSIEIFKGYCNSIGKKLEYEMRNEAVRICNAAGYLPIANESNAKLFESAGEILLDINNFPTLHVLNNMNIKPEALINMCFKYMLKTLPPSALRKYKQPTDIQNIIKLLQDTK